MYAPLPVWAGSRDYCAGGWGDGEYGHNKSQIQNISRGNPIGLILPLYTHISDEFDPIMM